MDSETSGPSTTRFDTSLLTPPFSYTIPEPAELTAEQHTRLNEVIAHFSKDAFELPVKEGDTEHKSGLTEREFMFLSRETFLRFITATKGDVSEAIKRIEACIVWRRTVKIEDVQAMADDCEPESRTGKNLTMGFSPQCRPIMYFFPNRNTTPLEQRRIVHPLFLIERARDLMPAGVSNVVVIFNFAGKRQGPPSSVSVSLSDLLSRSRKPFFDTCSSHNQNARQLLYILAQHYPETLSLSFFQDLPWIVKGFINLMWPFVDPNTRKKDVEASQLLKECGGDLNIPYEHDSYWKPMVDVCLDIRQKQEETFRALGPPRVGVEEQLWRRAHGSMPPSGDVNTGT
ncbi:CRAL-TRIO domain-containing protein [Kockovaella imperatae]|uniref:CRAL-TRIO domain-containing protein n=1 Tax=Kockovaella imperatae TaxID=4999 RepID=A0A1Y1UDI6_9TREE|nr:CRAL-TRIO domain-containing protein [Kockovaella imperatae]ORX36093.1 CRAL-TRIO domain-containing protein [Kockovaella imperatae]